MSPPLPDRTTSATVRTTTLATSRVRDSPVGEDGPVSAVRVRAWVEEDLPAIGRLHSLSRRHAYAGLVDEQSLARVTPEAQQWAWRERWARLGDAEDTRHLTLLAEDTTTGEMLGFAVAYALSEPDGGSGAELQALHVLPQHHGAGVGAALMEQVLAALRGWGARTAHLLVLEGNERAQAFYRRTGWTLRGPAGTHDVGGAQVPVVRYEVDLT